MSNVTQIPLIEIILPAERARSYDPLKAQALAGSIAAQGLFHPISLRPVTGGYLLVSGLHRYRAVEMTGATEIEARVTDLSDDEARLVEVMENLARAELIALDRCQHLYELKQSYERQYPEAANGGDRRSDKIRRQSLPSDPNTPEIFGFAQHIAEQIGLSQRAIRLAVNIWKGLYNETRPRLYGTDLAKKQTELKALSELSPVQQSKVLDLIFDENSDVTNVAGAVAALSNGLVLTPVEKKVKALSQGLASVADETLDLIVSEHADRVIASLKRTGRI
ncbi:ParB/RepB/Spo0J family partition protein [Planktotalea sp.]|uniref:ParB/RepB/Spo0J family partition protein n=1 Tax=Planktotalea sp. TaxID=2029877 RepID=UPI003D6B849A